MDLVKWIEENRLTVEQNGNYYQCGGKVFYHVHSKDGAILSKEGLIMSQQDYVKTDFYLFKFGDAWYYTDDPKKVVFQEFRYVGEANQVFGFDVPFLGIHSGYEICSGSGDYNEYVKKAKFLNVSTLGVCEKHTLAGAVHFQQACKKQGIKSILGETFDIMRVGLKYSLKLYAKNTIGWRNLLNLHKLINVDRKQDGVLSHKDLNGRGLGLVCVIDSSTPLSQELIEELKGEFDYVCYQFDSSEYLSPTYEAEHLKILKDNYHGFQGQIDFVLISDAYYVNKDQANAKKKLHKITKEFHHASDAQYLKSWDDYFLEIQDITKSFDFSQEVFRNWLKNTEELGRQCDFNIKIKEEFYLPEYDLSDEELEHYDNKEQLFWANIEAGLKYRLNSPSQEYFDRVQKEVSVIMKGGFIDYFLILSDIITWAKSQGILVGIARGSVGGSLVAYLMGITDLNPMEHNLMFERFLNEGRIGQSLPDIDVDFQTSRRDEVKRYMEDRYGHDNVCSIGTYGTFKLKQAIKDVGRLYHLTPASLNWATKFIPDLGGTSWQEVFDAAMSNKAFKSFVQDNYDLIQDVKLILNQPKTQSVHAAGVVITPSHYKGESMCIWDWMPVKLMDGVLISEWEGSVIEDTGFLKEDILGLRQLDKFDDIFKLIKKRGDKVLGWTEYNYNDPKVLSFFAKGYNQDVFQFQGSGMAVYSRELKPKNFEEVIAMNALYRPGPMDSNAHMDFVDLKNGRKREMHDFGLEQVTKDTGGMYIYQEQIMQAVQVLGGFNLNEADDIRKAMGKKLADKMVGFKQKFIDGAVAKGCAQNVAEAIWKKLEVFSGYGFNKSHATAYAQMGYVSQWLKAYYPLEFWATSLSHSTSDQLAGRLSEIKDLGAAEVMPPDINKSGLKFEFSYEDKEIYWALNKVAQVGDKVVEAIIEERVKAPFQSFRDAYQRIPKKVANKQIMYNLILAGAFDKIEGITQQSLYKRFSLLQDWTQLTGSKMPEEINQQKVGQKVFWINLQKNISGYGQFSFEEVLKTIPNISLKTYLDEKTLLLKQNLDKSAVVCGFLSKIVKRNSKNGQFAILNLEGNHGEFVALVWAKVYESYKTILDSAEGKMVVVTGRVREDKYNGGQSLHTLNGSVIYIIEM